MSKLFIDRLTGGFKELVELLGFEAAEKLARRMGGQEIYIPKIDSLDRMMRNESIIKEFNGENVSSLAMEHKLSERQIRNILDTAKGNHIQTLSIENFLSEEE